MSMRIWIGAAAALCLVAVPVSQADPPDCFSGTLAIDDFGAEPECASSELFNHSQGEPVVDNANCCWGVFAGNTDLVTVNLEEGDWIEHASVSARDYGGGTTVTFVGTSGEEMFTINPGAWITVDTCDASIGEILAIELHSGEAYFDDITVSIRPPCYEGTLVTDDFEGETECASNEMFDHTGGELGDLNGNCGMWLFAGGDPTDTVTVALEEGEWIDYASVRVRDYGGGSSVTFVGAMGSETFTFDPGQWFTIKSCGLELGKITAIELSSNEGFFDDITVSIRPPCYEGTLVTDDFEGETECASNEMFDHTGGELGDLNGNCGMWLFAGGDPTDTVTVALEEGEWIDYASVRVRDYGGGSSVTFVGAMGSETFTFDPGQWFTINSCGLELGKIMAIELSSNEGFFDDITVSIRPPCYEGALVTDDFEGETGCAPNEMFNHTGGEFGHYSGNCGVWLYAGGGNHTDMVTFVLEEGEWIDYASLRVYDFGGGSSVTFVGTLGSETFTFDPGQWSTINSCGVELGKITAIELFSNEGFFDDITVSIRPPCYQGTLVSDDFEGETGCASNEMVNHTAGSVWDLEGNCVWGVFGETNIVTVTLDEGEWIDYASVRVRDYAGDTSVTFVGATGSETFTFGPGQWFTMDSCGLGLGGIVELQLFSNEGAFDDITFSIRSACADTNGDGAVNVDDLVNVILAWETDGSVNGGDVDGSGWVDVDDLTKIILTWGPCE